MTPIIIANWKMNLSLNQRKNLALDLKKKIGQIIDHEVVICPSFISLVQISEILKGSEIKLGAQDVFWEESGAYTGEISPKILKDINCEYAIVGHSERRQNFGENDEMVNKRTRTCLDNDLIPIICVGETAQEHQDGRADNIVLLQLTRALQDIDLVDQDQIVVVYEPVWAVGTGHIVSDEEADHMFKLIRQIMIDLYSLTIINNNVRLIYGGSVNDKNVKKLADNDLISGFLVGGASLNVDQFVNIVKSIT